MQLLKQQLTKISRFNRYMRILGVYSPFIKYTYVAYIYLVTKEQKIWQIYIKHSKHQKRIMPIIIHSCAFVVYSIYFETFWRGKSPLFGWKLPKAGLGGVRRRPLVPPLVASSPLWGDSALMETVPVRVPRYLIQSSIVVVTGARVRTSHIS